MPAVNNKWIFAVFLGFVAIFAYAYYINWR